MYLRVSIPRQSWSRIIFNVRGFSGAGLKITLGLRVMDSTTQSWLQKLVFRVFSKSLLNFTSPPFLEKVQFEKAPILFEVFLTGGLSLKCASQFQNCVKRFHSEETVSKRPISSIKKLAQAGSYRLWLYFHQSHVAIQGFGNVNSMRDDVGKTWTEKQMKTRTTQAVTGVRVSILGGGGDGGSEIGDPGLRQ